MSLTTTSLPAILRTQLRFKLAAYRGMLLHLIVAQLIAMILTMGGMSSFGTSSRGLHVQVKLFSGDFIIIISMLWIAIVAMVISSSPYRNTDFIFVSSRLSHHLANIGILLAASMIGGISAMLGSLLQKLAVLTIHGPQELVSATLPGITELIIGSIAAIFYLVLFGAVGYFIGILCQLFRPLMILLPIVFVGMLLIESGKGKASFIAAIVRIYAEEASLGLFITKVIVSVAALYMLTILITSRKEVGA